MEGQIRFGVDSVRRRESNGSNGWGPFVSDTITSETTAIDEAQALLLASRNSDGGWAYYAGEASSTEPTALAFLALHARGALADVDATRSWLRARQMPSGFFTTNLVHDEPSWATPLAGIALAALGDGDADAVSLAASAMLTVPVYTPGGPLVALNHDYDTSVPGWPWTYGDYSFPEPTALAVTFLKQQGRGGERRVRDAIAMFAVRALPEGWNYGEPSVLKGALFPAVAPTALSLIALADEQNGDTQAGLAWLDTQRGKITSMFSLGWTGVALNVLGLLDEAWRAELVALWAGSPADRRQPMDAALFLLALSESASHPFRVA